MTRRRKGIPTNSEKKETVAVSRDSQEVRCSLESCVLAYRYAKSMSKNQVYILKIHGSKKTRVLHHVKGLVR
jgi:hypothetical protein